MFGVHGLGFRVEGEVFRVGEGGGPLQVGDAKKEVFRGTAVGQIWNK